VLRTCDLLFSLRLKKTIDVTMKSKLPNLMRNEVRYLKNGGGKVHFSKAASFTATVVPEAINFGATRGARPWQATGVPGDEASLRQKVLPLRANNFVFLTIVDGVTTRR
jgi:hypothetical protein